MNATAWQEKALKGLKKLSDCRFESFNMIHGPPYRSLNNGATGIAYTFWKAANVLDDPEWLHHARLWIDHTVALPEDDRIVGLPEDEGDSAEIEIEDSLYHGNRGLQFVKMLVAYAQADDYNANKFLRQFEKPTARRSEAQELLQGVPGRLVGFAILYEETGYDYIKEKGDEVTEELLGTADLSMKDTLWGNNRYLGIAHGRAGILYSLLFWSRASGYVLPDRIHEEVTKHAAFGIEQEHGLRWPIQEHKEDRFMDSWCHGTPGQLHLCSLAYELYKEPLFLKTARGAGESIIHIKGYPLGHLCCGSAGASYALLSLNRIDPGGPWLDHAIRFAEMSEKAQLITRFRLGLYTGLAGVVCLMLDMTNVAEARQPGFQG
ncbi:MAG: hypothetical protein JSV33_14875 [bacterium]|nr:MAG: hypothetical protein JSV33_14875 [bacterium]